LAIGKFILSRLDPQYVEETRPAEGDGKETAGNPQKPDQDRVKVTVDAGQFRRLAIWKFILSRLDHQYGRSTQGPTRDLKETAGNPKNRVQERAKVAIDDEEFGCLWCSGMTRSTRKVRPTPPAELLIQLLDHQRWLTSNGRFGAQLKGSEIDFVNMDLSGMDLSRVDLESSRFKGGSLRGARLVDSKLFGVGFYDCDVTDTDFSNANLGWASFITNYEAARFDGANLNRTAWTKEQDMQNLNDFCKPQREERRVWPRPKLEPK
jgi:hypothetical protein